MTHLIVCDTNYLCHRAFHAIPGLSHQDVPTSVPFGLFSEIERLHDKFPDGTFVFCFDRGKPLRMEISSGYKGARRQKRKEADEEEKEARKSLREQIKRLAEELLPGAGFKNILFQRGYEADDLVAAVCLRKNREDRATIIAADQDLWQLLSSKVRIWNPSKKEFLTAKKFQSEWGLEPLQWTDVKALAGCSSDSVEGVPRVGEKTAAKFLRGELNPSTKAYEKIVMSTELWKFNKKLVCLPFDGTTIPEILPDEVTKEKWRDIRDQIGMTSLRESFSSPRRNEDICEDPCIDCGKKSWSKKEMKCLSCGSEIPF